MTGSPEIQIPTHSPRKCRTAGQRGAARDFAAAFWVGCFLLLVIGCEDAATDTFPISKFTTWTLPADGTRIPAPRALYADEDDTVYSLDDAGRVLIYSSQGEVLNTWHMPDYEAGRPEGIVKLLDGRIAVADTHYDRVVFFNADGSVQSMIGEKGTEPSALKKTTRS